MEKWISKELEKYVIDYVLDFFDYDIEFEIQEIYEEWGIQYEYGPGMPMNYIIYCFLQKHTSDDVIKELDELAQVGTKLDVYSVLDDIFEDADKENWGNYLLECWFD